MFQGLFCPPPHISNSSFHNAVTSLGIRSGPTLCQMSVHLKSYLPCQPVKSLEQPSEEERKNSRQRRLSVSHLLPQGLSVLQYFPLCQLPEWQDRAKTEGRPRSSGSCLLCGLRCHQGTKAAPDFRSGSPSVGSKEETERTHAHSEHWANLQGTDWGTKW